MCQSFLKASTFYRSCPAYGLTRALRHNDAADRSSNNFADIGRLLPLSYSPIQQAITIKTLGRAESWMINPVRYDGQWTRPEHADLLEYAHDTFA